MGVSALAKAGVGRTSGHRLPGLLRQAVYGRLAGYEDVNDADRLARDPVMRAIVGREGCWPARGLDQPDGRGSRPSGWQAEANLAALATLSGAWIDRKRSGDASGSYSSDDCRGLPQPKRRAPRFPDFRLPE